MPTAQPTGGVGAGGGGRSSGGAGGISAGGSLGGSSNGGRVTEGGEAGVGGESGSVNAGQGGIASGGRPSGGSTSSGGVAGSTAGSTSGGVAGGGGVSGGASGGAPNVPELIDDLEHPTAQIIVQGERDGYWYTSADSSGSVSPQQGGEAPPTELPSDDLRRSATNRSAFHLVMSGGTGTDAWGALGGFDFHIQDGSGKKQPYSGKSFNGIQFYARAASATASIRVRIPIVATSADAVAVTGVTPCTKCEDHFYVTAQIPTTWTQIQVLWNDPSLTTDKWGAPTPTFDPATLVGVQFFVRPKASADIWIDDVSFIPISQ